MAWNAVAARAGMTMIDASEAMLPLMPRKSTVALSAHSGTPRMARRMKVSKSPVPSARPMAICMASTRPSGAKFEKLSSMFSTIQTRPSRLMMLCTATVSPVVGLTADTPASARTADRMARPPVMYRNRMNGCGSMLPTRSMVPRTPPVLRSFAIRFPILSFFDTPKI